MTLTPAQLSVRKGGISGSDVAAVLGQNPYRSPLEVWLDKTGQGKRETEDNFNLRRGKHLGPALIPWLAEETGWIITHAGHREETLVHKQAPLCIATPDGRIRDKSRRVLAPAEVKAPHWVTRGQWGDEYSGDVPDLYVYQATWEMAVVQSHWPDSFEGWCGFGALIDGKCKPYVVPWDEGLFNAMYEGVERFWSNHVLTMEPPEIDASEACSKWLEARYPKQAKGVMIPANPTTAALMHSYDVARDDVHLAQAAKDWASNRLKAAIGENEGIEAPNGLKCTWKLTKDSRKTDWEKAARFLAGEAGYEDDKWIKQFTETKPGYRRFNLTGGK